MAKKAVKTKTTTTKKAKKSKLVERKNANKTQVRLAKPKKLVGPKESAHKKEKPVGHAPHSARITAVKGPMQPVVSRTQFGVKNSNDRKWLIIDAAGQTVGRLASEIANLLRGKHKPTYTPNNDAGDFVIVLNAEKVKFTAAKEDNKEYFKHSGWIGGLKVTTPARLRKTYPDRIIYNAVKGMVPRSPLGRDQMGKLNIYAGDKHPHAAQNPVAWKLRNSSVVSER